MLMAQNAFAGEYNPFLGTVGKDSPVQKPSSKAAKLPDAIPAPLPAMPAYAPSYRVPGTPGPQPGQGQEIKEAPSYKASGRIGDQVVLTDHSGVRVIVQDGTMKAGCFVRYPDVICDKDEMTQAKREFAVEVRAKEEEEATAATQKAKITELTATVAKLREELNASAKDTSEVASLKIELTKGKAQVQELQKQFAVVNADLAKKQAEVAAGRNHISDTMKRLEATAAEFDKKKAEADAGRNEVAILQKKLDAAMVRGVKADMELASLKASLAAPPTWVKGPAKVYKDAILGEVQVSHGAGQVFFCIAGNEEDSADRFFGKSVLRKERKGSNVYYALNSSSVRVKE